MIALLGIVTVLLEYIDRLIPIMPALCSMLLVTYYAFNYAGIIGRGLHVIILQVIIPSGHGQLILCYISLATLCSVMSL